MRATRGLSTIDLAKFFFRAWQPRFAAILLAVATLVLAASGSIADSLQLSPSQRADAALGSADARIQLPGSAPIGSDGRTLDDELRHAIEVGGGVGPSIDYVASGVRADGGDETTYILHEIDERATAAPRFELVSGEWPSEIGDALASQAIADQWPIGSEVQFYNGALRLRIVGTFHSVFSTETRAFIVPSGTWSSLRTLDADAATRLDAYAGRILRWSNPEREDAVVAAVQGVVAENSAIAESLGSEGMIVESRASIEATTPSANMPLFLVVMLGPLAAGLIAGLLAGAFTSRVRGVMWTVGVPYRSTRGAALLANTTAAIAGAIAGTLAGIGIGFAVRPLLSLIATQALGPVTSTPMAFLSVPLAAVGALVGTALAGRRPSGARAEASVPRSRSWDRTLFRIVVAVVLVSFGIFVSTGTGDIARLSLSSVLIASAIILAFVPSSLGLMGRWPAHSLAALLALRQLSSERRLGVATVGSAAVLQVLGCALAILVTSSVAQVNNSTESAVAPGQIVLEPALESQEQIDLIRAEFETALGLSDPVLMQTVGTGSDRGDGPTRVVATVSELELVLGTALTSDQTSVVSNGGLLLMKPPDTATVSFPANGDFPGATLAAARVEGLDPSFRNVNGFILESAALDAGLPLTSPSYVYTHATPDQVSSAKAEGARLNLNDAWVKVYREPDVLTAPLRVSAITVLIALFAGIVILLATSAQARGMRSALAGLRAIGMDGGFLARVVGVRVGVTAALATVFGLVSSTIGVAATFTVARLNLGVTIPVLPIAAMVLAFAGFAAVAAVVATRRLRNSEWQV